MKNLYIPLFTIGVACILIWLIIRPIKTMESSNEQEYIGRAESVPGEKMSPELLLTLGRLSDPQLSPHGKYILYGVSYNSIEQNRSCRNLFLCKADGSNKVQLTSDGKSISCARWADGGSRIVFLQGGQIWSAPLKRSGSSFKLGKRVQLSDVAAGIGEFAISPDGSKIMYSSTVKSGVKTPSDVYPELDKAEAICTEDLMYRHWDHWVNELPHTFVASFDANKKGGITAGASKDILPADEALCELPIEPFGGLEQLSWSPDGKYIAYSCKKLTGKEYAFSTDTEIYIYNVETGVSAMIAVGGGYDTDPSWSPDGRHLCWISMERNGYEADKQRLMVADINYPALAAATADGATQNMALPLKWKEITADFKYNVAGPCWEGDDRIWFNSLAEGLQGIFCAELDGSSGASSAGEWKIVRYTDESLWYDFGTPFGIIRDEDGLTLLTTWQSLNFPTELVAVALGAGSPSDEAGAEACTAITHENEHLLGKLAAPKTEARYIKTVDGKDMLTWVMYPSDFDANKVYPAIEICLGGPQGTLSQGWSYRWNYRLMAEQGYIVVMPNRRGTTAFGQEWTEQISGDYIGLNMQDYLVAAKELKSEPYVGKMAACGASYGGYSIYYLCGIHGNTYDAFIAHAGIFNEEHMYMTTEEMWFPNWDNGGIPDEYSFDPSAPVGPAGDGKTFGGMKQSGSPWSDAPKAVRHYANSPHKLVTNWHTPLLVIHGGSDFRVPVDQGMAAYNAAQMMGVTSKLLIFPEENHWILKPQNALFWHREYFNWLDQWCK